MGLVGTLKDGTRITAIWPCEFEAPGLNMHEEIGPCGEISRYRVTFPPGNVLHACEEHAQYLWDTDWDADDGQSERAVTCDHCGQIIQFVELFPALGIHTPDKMYTVCSYTCMTELGWTLREDQPKLSKSRTEQSEA